MAASACLRLPASACLRLPARGRTCEFKKYAGKNPSRIVTTQCDAKTEMRRRACLCLICHGTGRADCFNCSWKGAEAVEGVVYVNALTVLAPESTDSLWVSAS